MNANNNADMSSLDSLLDGTLDDLADMPEFKPFPAGAHRCTIKWSIKEIAKQQCPNLDLKAIETVELANEADAPVAAGDGCNIAFMFKKKDGTKNELGEGQFKNIMKSLAEHFGAKSPRDLMAESNDAEVLAVTKIRKSGTGNDEKSYLDLVSITVL